LLVWRADVFAANDGDKTPGKNWTNSHRSITIGREARRALKSAKILADADARSIHFEKNEQELGKMDASARKPAQER